MAAGLPETLQLILISPSIKLDLAGHYSRLGDFTNSPDPASIKQVITGVSGGHLVTKSTGYFSCKPSSIIFIV